MSGKTTKSPGLFGRFWGQQKKAVYSDASREFTADIAKIVRHVRAHDATPTRVETFQNAIDRFGLTADDLKRRETRFKHLHWGFYSLAFLLVLYALYVALNNSLYVGIVISFSALACLTQGYVYGFRAWQVQNRNLISLPAALRNPDTFLIL